MCSSDLVDDLRNLNSHVLRMTTPPDDPEFQLILPKGYGDSFQEKVASLPESERVLWKYHTVRKGDTLSTVAKKYGASVTQLRQANNISPKSGLRVGQQLIIPISGAPASTAQVSSNSAKTTAVASTPRSATYTVRQGDTLTGISSRYGITVANLTAWNGLKSTNLVVGAKLVVAAPAPASKAPATADAGRKVVNQVRAGETLYKIATAYKTTVNAIRSWNKDGDLTVLHPGDRITIFMGSGN